MRLLFITVVSCFFGFLIGVVLGYILEKLQRQSLAQPIPNFSTKAGDYLRKLFKIYIKNLVAYFALALIMVCGLAIFLLSTSSAPGYGLWFIVLYVTVGATMNILYNVWPVWDPKVGKSGILGKLLKPLGILIYYVMPSLVFFILIPYCGMRYFLPDNPHNFVLTYAIAAFLAYCLFRWRKLMDILGFVKNRNRLLQTGRIQLMIPALLALGFALPRALKDTGISQKELKAAGEQLLILSAGHYFWVITDCAELIRDFKHLLKNYPLECFLVSIIISVCIAIASNGFSVSLPYWVMPFLIGIFSGLAVYVLYSIHTKN